MHLLFWVMITLSSVKSDMPILIKGEKCPSIRGKLNFDVGSYLGQWFQLSSLPVFFMKSTNTCVWAKYTMLPSGNIAVNNSAIHQPIGLRTFFTGEAAVIRSGELNVQFGPPASSQAEPNYFVLDTDYTEFAYVWSCVNFPSGHIPSLWILGREYDVPEADINTHEMTAVSILNGFGYSVSSTDLVMDSLSITGQHNCDY